MVDDTSSDSNRVSDPEALALAREESRAVLERKLRALDESNTKAMHTVRTAVVSLGLVISTLTLLAGVGKDEFGTATVLATGTGILCLVLSIVTGVVTYITSGAPDGISQSYRDDVRSGGFDEVDWLLILLSGYDQWVNGVDRAKQQKERRLLWVQLLLTVGLILVVAAMGFYVITN